jgi:hypothetical protein
MRAESAIFQPEVDRNGSGLFQLAVTSFEIGSGELHSVGVRVFLEG